MVLLFAILSAYVNKYNALIITHVKLIMYAIDIGGCCTKA